MWLCLVALLSFHEFGHAWMAHKCGDDTARVMGRMTINPIVHIDPIGTVLIPLAIFFFVPGFAIFLVGPSRCQSTQAITATANVMIFSSRWPARR